MSNAREIAMKVIYDVEFNCQNRIRRLFPILFTASQTEN